MGRTCFLSSGSRSTLLGGTTGWGAAARRAPPPPPPSQYSVAAEGAGRQQRPWSRRQPRGGEGCDRSATSVTQNPLGARPSRAGRRGVDGLYARAPLVAGANATSSRLCPMPGVANGVVALVAGDKRLRPQFTRSRPGPPLAAAPALSRQPGAVPPARHDSGRRGRRGGPHASSPQRSARGRRSRRTRRDEGEVARCRRTAQKTSRRGARWLFSLATAYKPRHQVGRGGWLRRGGLRRDTAGRADEEVSVSSRLREHEAADRSNQGPPQWKRPLKEVAGSTRPARARTPDATADKAWQLGSTLLKRPRGQAARVPSGCRRERGCVTPAAPRPLDIAVASQGHGRAAESPPRERPINVRGVLRRG